MKDFKKYYLIPATPEEVYIALTNPITLEIWTGDKAEMSTEPVSEFSLWDGNIVGKNLEFEEGKKLVQHWYFEGEPEDSIVTIKLHPHKQGCSMEVKQTNIPDEAYADMTEGWDDAYAGALVAFFEEQ